MKMKRKRKKKAAAKLLKEIRMFPNLALRHGREFLLRFSTAVSREAIFLALELLRQNELRRSESFVRRLKRAMAKCVIRSLCSSKLPGGGYPLRGLRKTKENPKNKRKQLYGNPAL